MAEGRGIKRHLGVFLPAMLSVVLFGATIFWVVLPQVQDAILAKKRDMVRELTLTVWYLLATYESQAQTGLMSLPEAQRRALQRIRELRYGDDGKDYFWVTDLVPHMLVHPYRPELEGRNVANYADPEGKRLFSDFVTVARQQGDGYVSYIWQWKDDPRHQAQKISHVRLFKPWGWIIGTGMYTDDVQAEMGALIGKLTLMGALVWAVVTLLAGYITWRNLRMERERREAQDALAESEEKFRSISASALDGLVMIDPEGRIIVWNPAAEKMFGFSSAEVQGQDLHLLLAPAHYHDQYQEAFRGFQALGTGPIIGRTVQLTARRKDGGEFPAEISVSSLNLRGRWHAVGIVRDITARLQAQRDKARLEDQLRQAQKMEAIGTLAGGIAHDFNNVLQAISGHAQLALEEGWLPAPVRERLERIEESTRRAAGMTQGLMTLGRKVETRHERVDLNREIGQTVQVLAHTLPKMIAIRVDLDPELPPVQGDPGQLEQVLLNLANNAGQAMPEGGELGFTTRAVFLGEEDCQRVPCPTPGAYVLVEVSDTGMGMNEEVRARIFEPFFTTKPLGKGTGLGLSTVYAIIAAHGGQIICESASGLGTRFLLYLPALAGAAALAPAAPAPAQGPVAGSETVLLVDDEEAILESCAEALARAGFRVLTAGSGEGALEVLGADPAAVDLVVLDLGMPGMGGLKCLEAIMALGAPVRVVVATGYASDAMVRQIMALGAGGILNKPYGFDLLLRRVRDVLDA